MTVFFVIAAGVNLIGVEFVRSIVDRRRKERDGLGGTQDIANWGALIGWCFTIASLVCGTIWIWRR